MGFSFDVLRPPLFVSQVSPVGEMGIREVKFPTDIVTFPSSVTSEGYDTEETATLLGLTPGAVKTRSHRGRAALKSLLRPIMRGEGYAGS